MFVVFVVSVSSITLLADVSAPVGYQRFVIGAQQNRMVALSFENQHKTLDALLQDQLTGSTDPLLADRIAMWDTASGTYITAFKADGTGNPQVDGHWFVDLLNATPSTLTFAPGSALTIESRQHVDQVVYLAGHVLQPEHQAIAIQPGIPWAFLLPRPYPLNTVRSNRNCSMAMS